MVHVAPATVTASVDRGAVLAIPMPSIATPDDVRDAVADGVRVLSVKRATPAVIVRTHSSLFDSVREGMGLELPAPVRTLWAVSGDPARVDPALRKSE